MNPTKEQIELAIHLQEGQIVARRFTVHGEQKLRRVKGELVPLPLDITEPNDSLAQRYRDEMIILYDAVRQIEEKGVRFLPITRTEMLYWKVQKDTLRGMQKAGLIEEKLIDTIKVGTTNKKASARVVVYFTPLGRGYIRKFIDDRYMQERTNGDSEGLGETGDLVRPSPNQIESGSDTQAVQ
jgi:hypothetical protein